MSDLDSDNPSAHIKRQTTAALTLGAIGVVYGDIGTSPLYTVKEVFQPATGLALNAANLVGAVSAILWALMLVVTLKYVVLILRADHHGEGGGLALTALAAQAVAARPGLRHGLLLLGVPITAYAALQLAGRSLTFRVEHRPAAELTLGAIGGLYGGFSGVWGPPLLVYLLSIGAGKLETVRVQGVVFLIGATVLLGAHLQSGVLTGPTLTFSAILVIPALIGQTLGTFIQDRLDQTRFRRWTLILLVLTGLNLARRAVW